MDKKTVGIIATITTSLLCGCPGIFVCLFGALSALGLGVWSYEWFGAGRSGAIPTWISLVILGGGVFLIAIPIVIGVLMLHKEKPKPTVAEVPPTS
jgi:hypothetical protein